MGLNYIKQLINSEDMTSQTKLQIVSIKTRSLDVESDNWGQIRSKP